MEFHDYPPAWKTMAAARNLKGSPRECFNSLQRLFGKEKQYWNTLAQLHNEILWSEAKRPYYDLYAGIAEAFTRVDLQKIKCNQLELPLPQMLVRLPVGYEVSGKHQKIRSILVSQTPSTEHKCSGWLFSIYDGSTVVVNGIDIPVHTVAGISLIPGTFIADRLAYGRENPYCDDELDDEEVDAAVRIVAALCMLKDDSFLIEQVPLASDLDKWEKTHDPALIEKAARRGKRAWAVGKQIELAPTFRRPHFAIRWCGPGRGDPRLRPIKGCIVLREKAKEFPTGYLE